MPNFLFGLTGSISIYKSIDIISKLKKNGDSISVIMTLNATKFIRELTFATFTEGRTYSDWSIEKPVLHIDLARWTDVFIVAPASANTISSMANGLGNNLLLSTILAYDKPIYLVPSMNTKMYENIFIQKNIKKLKTAGHIVLEPESGILACGEIGKGRFPNPTLLYDYIKDIYIKRKKLDGKKVLISAGPTKEDIDPVRYITNRSSGKMGYSLALEAIKRGAEVTLVSGETNLLPPLNINKFIKARSAEDFYKSITKIYENYDIIIMSAAIADYTPEIKETSKIKKSSERLSLKLKRTQDVLKFLGKHKKDGQILVGFAAETEETVENAEKKLKEKNLDYIIANNVSSNRSGFQSDYNAAVIISKSKSREIELCTKDEMAREIFDFII